MLSIVKEVGIFIVIAQAILYFVPGEAYVKYIKVLIGVIMIAKLAFPVFAFLSGDGMEELTLQEERLLEEIQAGEEAFIRSDSYENIISCYENMIQAEREAAESGKE
ncbi:MAG: stage III sporulation protein AF [Lachnospiraceae bacterium]|nr:stage III sporulation protein AF [Lachnospiraceae bacterium]